MAKRGFDEGWDYAPWARPIQEVLMEEQRAARAQQLQAEERQRQSADAERARARQEAIQARVETGQMLKASRGVLANDMMALGKMSPAVIKVAESFMVGIDKLTELPPEKKLRIILGHMRAVQMLEQALHEQISSERAHMGEPEKIIGIQVTSGSDLTLEQAEKELAELKEMVAASREMGLLDSDEPTGDLDLGAEVVSGNGSANGNGSVH